MFSHSFDIHDIQSSVLRKCNRHILPWLFSLGIVCYLDRTNLSFAALQLSRDLHLSCSIYGLGAGLFFLGYCLFQIPSQLVLIRLGAPLWLSITIVAWGLIAALMAAINSPAMFLTLRVLLGMAECGTFPGIWAHLSKFYSSRELGSAYASVATSTALAQVIGAPIAAVILSLDGFLLHGWQWLFIIEGCTTIVFAVLLKKFLAPSPAEAMFLTSAEREWLQRRHDDGGDHHSKHSLSTAYDNSNNNNNNNTSSSSNSSNTHSSNTPSSSSSSSSSQIKLVIHIMKDWRMWWLSAVWASITQAMYGIIFFTPMIIHSFFSPNNDSIIIHSSDEVAAPPASSSTTQSCGEGHGGSDSGVGVALMSTLPFAAAAAAMVLNAKLAEAANERHRHGGIPILLAALFTALTPVMLRYVGAIAAYIFLILAAGCIWSPHGPLMSFPAVFLEKETASVAFAFMNSIGTLGGGVSPFVLGFLADKTGGTYSLSMLVMASVLACGGVMMLCFPVNGGTVQPVVIVDDDDDDDKVQSVEQQPMLRRSS